MRIAHLEQFIIEHGVRVLDVVGTSTTAVANTIQQLEIAAAERPALGLPVRRTVDFVPSGHGDDSSRERDCAALHILSPVHPVEVPSAAIASAQSLVHRTPHALAWIEATHAIDVAANSLIERGFRLIDPYAQIYHRGPRLEMDGLRHRFEWWCINLDRRPDRIAHVRTQLARVGLPAARRFQAFDGHQLQLTSQRPHWVRKGAVGCYLSHLALLKQAQARRSPCVIIEDDIVFANNFFATFRDFLVEVPEDWDVLHLPGRDHQKPPISISAQCTRLQATWGTSMSIFRLPAIDRLLEEADGLDRPIDDFYIRMMQTLRFYSPAQPIVWQHAELGTNIGDHG